jgi:cell division inhibitor SepF
VPHEYEAQVTPIRANGSHALVPTASHASHEPELRRITTVHPRSYNDARKIGEAFRDGTPVIMNLSDMDDADAKRLVDFSAGLIFGLHGAIERVTNKVFLLSPAHVEVTAEEQAVPGEMRAGFYNQS